MSLVMEADAKRRAIIRSIKTGKFDEDALMKIGRTARETSVWGAIVQTGKLSIENLYVVGKEADYTSVWDLIIPLLKFDELTPQELFHSP